MLTTADKFEAELSKIVADEREQAVRRLVGGVEDYATYREVLGFISALDRFTDEWLGEATKNAEER